MATHPSGQPSSRPATSHSWKAIGILGLVAAIFGLAILIWPQATLGVLISLFGAYALITGIFAAIAAYQAWQRHTSWWALALQAFLGIVFGLLIFLWPSASILVLLYFIAFWAVLTGVPEILAGLSEHDWFHVASGAVLIVFGLVLVAAPLANAALIGIFVVVYGAVTLARAYWLHQSQPVRS